MIRLLSISYLSTSSPSALLSLMWTVTVNTVWLLLLWAFIRVAAVFLLAEPFSRIL